MGGLAAVQVGVGSPRFPVRASINAAQHTCRSTVGAVPDMELSVLFDYGRPVCSQLSFREEMSCQAPLIRIT